MTFFSAGTKKKNTREAKGYSIVASLRYSASSAPTYENLHLFLPHEKVTCLLGESGCGKSSFLRQIAGLDINAFDARLSLGNGGQSQGSFAGQVAYMSQSDLLMPWLSVLDNVLLSHDLCRPFLCYPLGKRKERGNAQLRNQALELLDVVGLSAVAHYLPQQLSGGMRQRTALARTLMQNKPIVLMDEPFSALDAVTRYKLQDLAAETLAGKTVLLVTHDPQEALRLGEKIVFFPKQHLSKQKGLISVADSGLIEFPSPVLPIPRAINSLLGEKQKELLACMRAFS